MIDAMKLHLVPAEDVHINDMVFLHADGEPVTELALDGDAAGFFVDNAQSVNDVSLGEVVEFTLGDVNVCVPPEQKICCTRWEEVE
jgi:hypothetical protein